MLYKDTLLTHAIGGVFTIPQHLSSSAVDLVSSMLRVDPLLRATIANVT